MSTNQVIIINDDKPVELVDLKAYKIIGLTLSNQSKDDMLLFKSISIIIRNYVIILDLDKFKFTGPKYNGTFLVTLCHKLKNLQNDSIFYLNFLKQFTYFYLNFVFIFQNSANFNRD